MRVSQAHALNPAPRSVRRAPEVRALILGLALSGAGCVGPFSDDVEASYRTLAEARSQGAVGDHTWIPAILPEAATDIVEFHNIDAGATWGCFRPNGQGEQVVRLLHGRAAHATRGPVSEGPKKWLRTRDWWPEVMTHDGTEVFEFKEPSAAAALSEATIRVGIDRLNNVVCFQRRR